MLRITERDVSEAISLSVARAGLADLSVLNQNPTVALEIVGEIGQVETIATGTEAKIRVFRLTC